MQLVWKGLESLELISRAFLNKIINKQFNTNKELNKDTIYKIYNLKPYKREGKTWLYSVKEVNNAGIHYKRNLVGYYPIPGFEEKFWIDKSAKIINVTTEREVATVRGVDLYEHVTLRFYGKKYRKRVHSLMGKTFLGNPPVINHIDGNKTNNTLNNLERSTHRENIQHAYDNNYYSSRGGNGTKVEALNSITGERMTFPSLRKAEAYTGVTRHRIKYIIEGSITNNTNWEFKYK